MKVARRAAIEVVGFAVAVQLGLDRQRVDLTE